MRVLIVGAALVVCANTPPGPSPLWQGLHEGDTPEQAAKKLAEVEGVKSAKVRGGKVSVRYSEGGIDISGLGFKLVPKFENGALSEVSLVAPRQCVDKAQAVATDLARALALKYPDALLRSQDIGAGAMIDAIASATSEEPSSVTDVRWNDQTGVVFIQRVTYGAPPPAAGLAAGGLAGALSELAWSQHESYLRECQISSSYRVQLSITYMSRAALNRLTAETKAQIEQNDAETLDKL